VTKVVTRTRRRAASRPAGPPAGAVEDAQAALPIGEQLAAEPAPAEDPATVGAIGSPAGDGAVEPIVPAVEPGPVPDAAEPEPEEPHVEHVPIKKKGTRKR
jgi:ribonuclease E